MKLTITKAELALLHQALWDGKLWQDSVSDCHHGSIAKHNRTAENSAVAIDADRIGRKYMALWDKLKGTK